MVSAHKKYAGVQAYYLFILAGILLVGCGGGGDPIANQISDEIAEDVVDETFGDILDAFDPENDTADGQASSSRPMFEFDGRAIGGGQQLELVNYFLMNPPFEQRRNQEEFSCSIVATVRNVGDACALNGAFANIEFIPIGAIGILGVAQTPEGAILQPGEEFTVEIDLIVPPNETNFGAIECEEVGTIFGGVSCLQTLQ